MDPTKVFEHLWTQSPTMAVMAAFAYWFMKSIAIPMKDRHFQTMDRMESNYNSIAPAIQTINSNVVEGRKTQDVILAKFDQGICRGTSGPALGTTVRGNG